MKPESVSMLMANTQERAEFEGIRANAKSAKHE